LLIGTSKSREFAVTPSKNKPVRPDLDTRDTYLQEETYSTKLQTETYDEVPRKTRTTQSTRQPIPPQQKKTVWWPWAIGLGVIGIMLYIAFRQDSVYVPVATEAPAIGEAPAVIEVPVATEAPIVTSTSSLIAFEKWINGGEYVEIWVIRSDGTDLHQLTEGFYDTGSSFSPDGQYIAFSRNGPEGIYIMNVDGTNIHQVSSNIRSYSPEWLDDRNLVFTSSRGNEQEFRQKWRLVLLSLDNMQENIIDVGVIGAFSPTLSPDHRYLAFEAGDYVYVATINGKNVSRVGIVQNGGGSYPLRWYPDGSHLVVSSEIGCHKMGLDGSVESLVGVDECEISWSPDGKRAVYQFSDAIWLMDADGQNKRLLVKPNDGQLFKTPVWSPNP
jgi:Tol biopolymer transport system component